MGDKLLYFLRAYTSYCSLSQWRDIRQVFQEQDKLNPSNEQKGYQCTVQPWGLEARYLRIFLMLKKNMVLIREEQNALVAHKVSRKVTDEKRWVAIRKGHCIELGVMVHTCNPSIWEVEAERLQVEYQPGLVTNSRTDLATKNCLKLYV